MTFNYHRLMFCLILLNTTLPTEEEIEEYTQNLNENSSSGIMEQIDFVTVINFLKIIFF